MVLRLCRTLSAFGIFEVDSEDMVSQSARSAWLRKDARPTLHHAALYWMTPGSWSAWERLEHGIRAGACPFEEVFGQPYFSYLKQHPEKAALLDQHMQHSPDDRHAAVAEAYDPFRCPARCRCRRRQRCFVKSHSDGQRPRRRAALRPRGCRRSRARTPRRGRSGRSLPGRGG